MRLVTKREDELRDREVSRLIDDKAAIQKAMEALQSRAQEAIDKLQAELASVRIFYGQAEGAKAELEKRILAEQDANKVLQVNLDWFRVRLTQVEAERAKLLYLHTGVKVETPEFAVREEAIEQERQSTSLPDIIAGFAGFQDIGDEEAVRQGIDWDEDGKVKYKDE